MKKLIKIIIPVFVLGIIFNAPAFVLGQTDYNDEIKELNSEIQNKKKEIDKIQEKQEFYSKTIKQKQKDQANLDNQIAILENRLAKAELDIESVEIEIDQINLEIKKVNLEIENKTEEIDREKEHIANVLKLMYKQSRVDPLEILLLNNSLADFVNQIKYLEDTNKEIGRSLDELKKYKKELVKNKQNLGDKNKELVELKEELGEKKLSLKNETDGKAFLLNQVRNSEKEYQKLLSQAKQEQAAAAADIANLEKIVRERIVNLSGGKLEFNDAGLIWPVTKNFITAYFHDPEYPFRYIFEHPGIDIRASQGTSLKAAASGYVARAKDAGRGYSYIMIIHGDGLSTVYGHVSKIYVSEDEYVVQGQTIGATGGMPGTHGAGRLTTGPHLHFEVRLNGIPVNPLEYLP